MSITAVTTQDLSDCISFLERNMRSAIFPLSNFRENGLAGKGNSAPRAMTFHAKRERGNVVAVLGQTNEGGLFPVFGELPADQYQEFQSFIRRPVAAVLGLEAHVRALLEGLDTTAPVKIASDEPQLELELAKLSLQPAPGFELTPITPDAFEQAVEWRAQFSTILQGEPAEQAKLIAQKQVKSYVEKDSHRILRLHGEPVAMTGFNARYKCHVQIGGVFTPPALRRNGYAGAAVGLHLLEARAGAATTALLSAATSTAARVYRRLGFRDCGRTAITLFETQEGPA